MKYLSAILVSCVILVTGCLPNNKALDMRDAVAVDLALATMTDYTPTPQPDPPTPYNCLRCQDTGWIIHGDGHRTPCPDCSSSDSDDYSGPLDVWRDAKDLIRKGNELADRGKELFDRVERDGKIRIDIQLPKPVLGAQPTIEQEVTIQPCSIGVCPTVLGSSKQVSPTIATQPAALSYGKTHYQPRLFFRLRR